MGFHRNYFMEKKLHEARPDQTGWSQVTDLLGVALLLSPHSTSSSTHTHIPHLKALSAISSPQVFAPPRTDGPGNFGNHEQNGGRLFSVSKMVFEACLYPEAAEDWSEQVRGLGAIASTLLNSSTGPHNSAAQGLWGTTQNVSFHGWHEVNPLPFANLTRTPMPGQTLAHAYCEVAYGCTRQPSSCPKDQFGKTACDFYADMTFGLRDGLLGPTLELLKGFLGLQVHPDGTLRLHGETVVNPINCTTELPCRPTVSVSRKIAASWPKGVARVEMGGVNVGVWHNCSVAANIEYKVGGGVDLVYVISRNSL